MTGNLIIYFSLLVGMVLSVVQVPLTIPAELGYGRPDWVAMVMLYWIIALPERVGLVMAWIVGLIMDVLMGGLIGQHALSYLVIAYITFKLYQRLRMFSVWQQVGAVFVILSLNHVIWRWIENLSGLSDWSFWYLLPALTGACLWPWVFLLLRSVRRRFFAT